MRNLFLAILTLCCFAVQAQNEGLTTLKGVKNSVYSLASIKHGKLPRIAVKNPDVYELEAFRIVFATNAYGNIFEHSIYKDYSQRQLDLISNAEAGQIIEYRAFLVNKRTAEHIETIVDRITIK